MKKLFSFFSVFFLLKLSAQQPVVVTSADIYTNLNKLKVLGSVLYIAAHPDDENTRLLAYLSKEKLYRTGYLSLTRGDGGQNLIGDEQGIALGLIRTQELLAARRIDGAEQFFSRAYDFGFSKSPEETFTKWDKEKVLSDVVWVIRKFQPDVIITRFPTTGEGGHGHHTASAILANEAFSAAADPKRFPEQLKYVQPWQAKRILWNTFSWGNTNTQRPDLFRLDVGGFNPILGKSYGEIAAESRSQHKSQGFGVARSRGEAFEYFTTTGGTAPVNDLMDGVDASWKRVKNGEGMAASIQQVINSFSFTQPHLSVAKLVQLYRQLDSMPQDEYWVRRKKEEVQQLIGWTSGLFMEASTGVQNAVQGDSLRISFQLNNRGGTPAQLKRVVINGFDSTFNLPLKANQNFSYARSIHVPYTKPISQPYWLEEKLEKGLFTIKDQQMIGQPDISPAFTTRFEVEFEGVPFVFETPVQYKFTDPVKGELYQPVTVVPPATVMISPDLVLFREGQKQKKEVAVQFNANTRIQSPIEAEVHSATIHLTRKDSSAVIEKGSAVNFFFPLSNEKLNTKTSEPLMGRVNYYSGNKGQGANLAQTSITYDHIPFIRYFYSDDIKLLNIDLKTTGKKIGYIVGAGDRVPEALEQMGYEVTLLTDKEMARNNLQQFDAIISGVRAYNTNEWLNGYYEKLMAYVKEGGNLIVQYNTSSQIGPVRAKIGPYAFNITRNRVTDEEAPVSFLKPEHKVLNFPNKITPDDFKGWVQERSIYHAGEVDSQFEKILGMSDPGEKSDNSSLIIAKYGKGYFTYTGLVFFRELPAGVPGAYRLLANLISLNYKTK